MGGCYIYMRRGTRCFLVFSYVWFLRGEAKSCLPSLGRVSCLSGWTFHCLLYDRHVGPGSYWCFVPVCRLFFMFPYVRLAQFLCVLLSRVSTNAAVLLPFSDFLWLVGAIPASINLHIIRKPKFHHFREGMKK